jgi:hypothetical protein
VAATTFKVLARDRLLESFGYCTLQPAVWATYLLGYKIVDDGVHI